MLEAFVKRLLHDSCCNSRAFCACAGPKNCTNTSPSISWAQRLRVVTKICISPTGMEKKNTLRTMMHSPQNILYLTHIFRNIPGVWSVHNAFAWEEFDLFMWQVPNASSVSTKLKIWKFSRYDFCFHRPTKNWHLGKKRGKHVGKIQHRQNVRSILNGETAKVPRATGSCLLAGASAPNPVGLMVEKIPSLGI